MGMLELNQMGASWASVMPKWLQLWGLFAVFWLSDLGYKAQSEIVG